jgi:hypothetical protein
MRYSIMDSDWLVSDKDLRLLNYIGDLLPTGSGIDSDWTIKFTSVTRIRCSNSYHCMNDAGYYDGWADFTLLVDIHDPNYFKIQFHGYSAQYKSKKYGLREYLTDLLGEVFSLAFGDGPMHVPEDYKYE